MRAFKRRKPHLYVKKLRLDYLLVVLAVEDQFFGFLADFFLIFRIGDRLFLLVLYSGKALPALFKRTGKLFRASDRVAERLPSRLKLTLCLRNPAFGVKYIVFKHPCRAFDRMPAFYVAGYLIGKLLGISLPRRKFLGQLFASILKRRYLPVNRFKPELCRHVYLFRLGGFHPHRLGVIEPQRHVNRFLLFVKVEIFPCRRGFLFKRADTRAELGKYVVQAHKIRFRVLQLSLRLVFLVAVF